RAPPPGYHGRGRRDGAGADHRLARHHGHARPAARRRRCRRLRPGGAARRHAGHAPPTRAFPRAPDRPRAGLARPLHVRPTRLGALAVALVALECAGKKPIIPPDKLWGEAEDAFNIDAYELAVDRYKKLLDQHPFDQHAEEAELKIALSYYKAQRWAEAIAAFGDFERMHPTSAELPA